jgi:hypothetical protein
MIDPLKWYTDPHALGLYLAQSATQAATLELGDFSSSDQMEAISHLVYSIVHLRAPPVLLVNAGGHWVVVVGVRIGFSDGAKLNARVAGFFVADPATSVTQIEFRPVGDEFLNAVFSQCAIPGTWERQYVFCGPKKAGSTMESVEYETVKRPIGGGAGELDDDTVTDLIISDLSFYGAASSSRLLAGGAGPSTIHVKAEGQSPYLIKAVVRNGAIVWTIFNVVGLELTSVMADSTFQLPPSDSEVTRALQDKFGPGDVAVKDGVFWRHCLQLRSKYEVYRVGIYKGVEYYVTNTKRVIENFTTLPDRSWLAG